MILLPLLALAASACLANEAPLAWQPAPPPFEPVVGGSVFGQAGLAAGNAFTMLPLNDLIGWGSSVTDKVLFFEPLIGWQEGGEYEVSLGLGFRKLYGDPTDGQTKLARDIDLLGEGWYLGGNLFVDGMHSVHDLVNSQLSSGIEIGSRYLTLHANYYWPLSDAKRWGQMTTTQVTGHGPGNVYDLYVGPVVTSEPARGTHDIHVTTTPVESFRERLVTYGLYDEALRGWDTELSMLVPGIDKYVDFRLVAGLYGFDGGSTGRSFQGWQTGAEFRPVPAVVLMATRFGDGRYHDGQWMAGVRFEIPLGTGFHDSYRLRERSLSERLMEPVQRRNVPTVAVGTKQERATALPTVNKLTGEPATIEGLKLSAVPRPGDVIQLQNGTLLVVEADGKSLRPWREGDPVSSPSHGFIFLTPEPSRTVLVSLGLAVTILRRRRSKV